MLGLRGMAAVIATGSAAASTLAGGSTPANVPVSAFGGPVAVHVARVGRIEVDLESGGASGLRRIRCAGLPPRAAACFVAR